MKNCPRWLNKGSFLGAFFVLYPLLASDTHLYQMGSQWDRRAVNKSWFEGRDQYVQQLVQSIVKIGSSSGIFLGFYEGRAVLATNAHVITNEENCKLSRIEFAYLGLRVRCTQVIGAWPSIELSLIIVDFFKISDREKVKNFGKNFAFSSPIENGQPLTVMGFGRADNKKRNLTFADDGDCKIFSGTGQFRFMLDPDETLVTDRRVWSFAHGCDISHGDSGAPLVNRYNGEILGIVWSGKTPKAKKFQDSSYLNEIFESKSSEIWSELGYAVPSSIIYKFLVEYLSKSPQSLSPDSQKILSSILEE